MNDRIKLAEAMGWAYKPRALVSGKPCDYWKNAHWLAPNGREVNDANFPNPFTDANDDYAVLEWMRELPGNRCPWGYASGYGSPIQWDYQIGDYARAALKVIDEP